MYLLKLIETTINKRNNLHFVFSQQELFFYLAQKLRNVKQLEKQLSSSLNFPKKQELSEAILLLLNKTVKPKYNKLN